MDDQNDVASSSLNQSAAVAVTGKIMVAAIIVLFLVVVFVLFLHLYAKWFWWRIEETTVPSREARNPRRRRFVFAPGQDPATAGLRTGLDPALLRSLPMLVFDPAEFKDGLECAVCLSEVVRGEKARLLPKCSHGFHVDCIDMWFQSHSTCPICRNPVGLTDSAMEDSSSSSSSLHSIEEDPNSNPNPILSNESLIFPTNVLFWGNEVQVSSRGENHPSSSLQEPGTDPRSDGMLIIDIPRQVSESLSAEEDLKSPMTTRLRSLKRLLSKEKRVSPCTSSSCVESEPLGRSQNS